MLGLAPAASLAAKGALDAEIAKASGVALGGAAPSLAYGAGYGPPSMPADEMYDKAADYVRLFGIPEFAKENMRRNSGYVSCLDPDIASKKSWSMSVKILTQRERNLSRNIEQINHNVWDNRARKTFKTMTGWNWPW